jgi:hypothetical protein
VSDSRTRDTGQSLPGASRPVNELSATMKGKKVHPDSGGTTPPTPPPPAPTVGSVIVTPAAVTLAVGATQRFSAQVLDTTGAPMSGQAVTWGQQALSPGAAVTITNAGTATRDVTPTSAGTAAPGTFGTVRLDATAGGRTGAATITVPQPALPADPAPPPPPPPPTSALSASVSSVAFSATAAAETGTGGGVAFYVSPTGTSGNAGTADSPWSLAHALSGAAGAITPGATVWLAAGTYTGTFTSTLTGTTAAPIVVRAGSPAGWARATIDGQLILNGSDTWVWGLEVTNSALTPAYVVALDVFGPRCRVINCVVHDGPADGIGMWESAVDAEAHGNVLYNNGRASNGAYGHGFYVQNATGAKTLRNNVVFNSFAFGIHCYGEAAHLVGITLDANVVYESGRPAGNAAPNILVGGSNPVSALTVTSNTCWTSATDGTNVSLGYTFGSTANVDATLAGNWIAGGKPALRVLHFSALTASGNTFAHSGTPYELLDVQGTVPTAWSANAHYRADTASGWIVSGSAYGFAAFKAALPASTDTRPADALSGTAVVVQPNAYEAGRAHVVVRNPAAATSVAVDLSGVLTVGDTYTVHNVRDVFGPAVASGTYAGGTVTLPIAATVNPVPVGGFVGGTPSSSVAFQTYLVRRTSGGGGTSSAPASNPATQSITWSNPAGLTGLTVAEVVNQPWLAVSTLLGTTSATTTLDVTTGTLAAGTYTATVRGTQSGATSSPRDVTVTFTVAPAPASPLPPAPGTSSTALPLTAYRDPRVSSGTASDRAKNGVPLPRSGFTVTASELASLLVEVDGVEVSCFVAQRGAARPDGTLPLIWLEFAPGALAAGATKTGIVLRKGTPTRPRLTKQGNTFATDYTQGVYAHGVMPCYAFPSQADVIDSQVIDDGVRIPTAAELAPLTTTRHDQLVARFEANVAPFWSATATFPGSGGLGVGSNQSFDRLTSAYWPDATDTYRTLREKVLDPAGYYDMSRALRHHWLSTWDWTSFRRMCSLAWYYSIEWCYRERTRLEAQGSFNYTPGEFHQSVEALYLAWAIMGEERHENTMRLWAERWWQNGYVGADEVYGLASHLNRWNPTFASVAYRSRLDGRQGHRALAAIRHCVKIGATTDHNGNARDWPGIYRALRAQLNQRGTTSCIRPAPAPYAGLFYPDGVCPSNGYEGYYLNTWMAAGQLGTEIEAGYATIPETDSATLAALRATFDGLVTYLTTGPRYVTSGEGLKVVVINQDDGNSPTNACNVSIEGSQLEAPQYGVAGYRAAVRIAASNPTLGATVTSRLDTLLRDAWTDDNVSRDFSFYGGHIGKAFNQLFSYSWITASRKLFG